MQRGLDFDGLALCRRDCEQGSRGTIKRADAGSQSHLKDAWNVV